MQPSLHRLPWAALLALALVGAFEVGVLGAGGAWPWLKSRLSLAVPFEYGITFDRNEFQRARQASLPRVFVVGSSRANAGFRPHALRANEKPKAELLKICHGGLNVFELRSLADELVDADPEMVFVALSEFDMGSPLQVIQHGSFGSFPAVFDLARALGPSASWKHRTTLFRSSLEAASRAYRYRRVLELAVLEPFSRFELDDRYPRQSRKAARRNLVAGKAPRKFSKVEREQFLEAAQQTLVSENALPRIRAGFWQARRITRGAHVRANQYLIRRTIETLTDAGIRVVIFEPPLHPISAELYDASIREDFLAFAASLQSEFDIGFLPIESTGPFVNEDFGDLTHLNRTGGLKITHRVVAEINHFLDDDAAND